MNETHTHPLPIHITPHHLQLSPALVDFTRNKVAKVSRFANDVLAAEIVLRRHHGTSAGKRFSASARMALAGRDIHATATHADLYTAVVKLVARLARRSRKRKTRLQQTRATRGPAAGSLRAARSFLERRGVAEGETIGPETGSRRYRAAALERNGSGFGRIAPSAGDWL